MQLHRGKTNSKIQVVIAVKELTIAEHTIKSIDCANSYKLSRFKVIKGTVGVQHLFLL